MIFTLTASVCALNCIVNCVLLFFYFINMSYLLFSFVILPGLFVFVSTNSTSSFGSVKMNTSTTDKTTHPYPSTYPAEACNVTTTIFKANGEICSENYPNPYPGHCQWTYIIRVGRGYQMAMLLKVLDIEIGVDSFMVEPIGVKKNKNAVTSKPVTTPGFKMDIACCDTAIVKFASQENENHVGFCLEYNRVERRPQISEQMLPGWIFLHLAGLPIDEFLLLRNNFEEGVMQLVHNYCERKKGMFNDCHTAIVILNRIVECPSSWPWSQTCVQVNMSVVIHPYDEFNSQHLEEIWQMFKASEKLYELGISNYSFPNLYWFIWFWITFTAFMVMILLLLMTIVKRTRSINRYFRKLEKASEPEEPMSPCYADIPETGDLVFPLFTTENSQRYKFVRESERLGTASLKPNNFYYDNKSYNISEHIDDFDSDEDYAEQNDSSARNSMYHTYDEPVCPQSSLNHLRPSLHLKI